MSYWQVFKNGVWGENPVFRLALSLCPAIAVTTLVKNSILMGVALLFVITMVNITISCIRKYIHPRVRFPVYMFVIATWVTVSDLSVAAFNREIYKDIGLYIQLIVAFAIVLSRVETFSSKNKVIPSAIDGIGMGIGFLIALVLIALIREPLGKGSFYGYTFATSKPFLMMVLPAGGFLATGFLIALFNWADTRFFGGKGGSQISHH